MPTLPAKKNSLAAILAVFLGLTAVATAFNMQQTNLFPVSATRAIGSFRPSSTLTPRSESQISSSPFHSALYASSDDTAAEPSDPNEVVARRILITGDVNGGYFRTCVKNEASRFRKLIGAMSPPDDSRRAEIYVEGKLKFVDSFVRWCKRGDVGLSQSFAVEAVEDVFPTGIYEDFSVETGFK